MSAEYSDYTSEDAAAPDLTRFELLVKQRELNCTTAQQLKDVLSSCEIVLLCDDSDSMAQAIAEEGTDPFAPKRSTRWLELKKLASVMIEFVTAINPNGLDIYFLNREKITNVTNNAGLQAVFNNPPDGDTPLKESLEKIYKDKKHICNINRNLLIVVITDGEPSTCSRQDLFKTLTKITKDGSIHISFAECTDNAEDMEYLDQWDGIIHNFDNTDDYREELARVKNVQGAGFKFDYTDYVIKILLATFIRWYFNLDQTKVTDTRTTYASTQFQPQPRRNPKAPPAYSTLAQPAPDPNSQLVSPPTKGHGCCIVA